MTETGWRRFFLAAALLNALVGLSFLTSPATALATLGMTPHPDDVLVRLLGWTIGVLGAAYWLVSRNLARTELVWLGLIGKLGAVWLFFCGWTAGQLPTLAMLAGSADLPFAIGFALFLASGSPEEARAG